MDLSAHLHHASIMQGVSVCACVHLLHLTTKMKPDPVCVTGLCIVLSDTITWLNSTLVHADVFTHCCAEQNDSSDGDELQIDVQINQNKSSRHDYHELKLI